MQRVLATALPRAGLLGNPSDLYEGRGIGFTFEDFHAAVELRPSDVPAGGDLIGIEYGGGLHSPWRQQPEPTILQAARAILPELGVTQQQQESFALSLTCDIPQQVGLSGSSAIILAALRAVCMRFGLMPGPDRLAELTLRVETELLGIAAGPMDRVVQSYEGLVAMDFKTGEVERLDLGLLPPLRILIDSRPGQDSGSVHGPVRERWERGDIEVRNTMAAFRPLVEKGLAALKAGDLATLIDCVNRNFELRAQVFPIGKRDRKMIDATRQYPLGAKFCGSGGAHLVVAEDEESFDVLEGEAITLGWSMLKPTLSEVAV